jgi:methylenetetrahydrofolate dehydrogenase (NADP+)/methenyltetrahydrofolate cyclohydrolase
MIIDGKKIAEEIIAELKKSEPFDKLRARKFMAAVLVGEDPSSLSFIKQKEKTAKELRVDFRIYKFPQDLKNDELREEVRKIAEHKTCGGVIVQLPLPEHINRHYVLNVIPREKDIDVLGERALGAFYTGRNPVLPPAVGVVEKILNVSGFKLQDSRVVVVGHGLLVGKPIAIWLIDRTKELYILHCNSDFSILKNADVIISGAGEAGLLKPEMLKAGSGVIDFGYDMKDGKICGDFDALKLNDSSSKFQDLGFYTPTPGGTGPILVAKLFENFYKLNSSE